MKAIAMIILALATLTGCNRSDEPTAYIPDTLRVAIEGDPHTLDPRLSRTLHDAVVMQMLYEGLMRPNAHGEVENALAEKITISPDLKTYEVRLKPSKWSDGTPLVAADFVDTWKSLLDPGYPSANASQLFVIKGAKDAKMGVRPLDEVGLKVISDDVFTIELEQPTAYFTELLGTHFYLPLSASTRALGRAETDPKLFAFNGPFTLKEWKHHNQMTFAKNENYWDRKDVKLKQVVFVVADGLTALNLFKQNKLDWIGSPLSTLPQDAIPSLKKQKVLEVASSSGTYWFRFNTEAPPFNNVDMRKAFNLALNRAEIVEHVTQGNQRPALSILPPALALQRGGYFKDNQVVSAFDHFQQSLTTQGISKDDLPPITLCYVGNDRNHKLAQAAQQQWQSALGIPVYLRSCESKVSYESLSKGDYQIMLGSWFADFDDPINFLNVFKTKDNGTNNTRWEDASYAKLLDESNRETDPAIRRKLLQEAEAILMDNMPIAPLFYNAYNYVKKPHVRIVGLDFKNAQIRELFEETPRE